VALALLLVTVGAGLVYTRNGVDKAGVVVKKDSAPVTLEFAAGDIAQVTNQPLARLIAISGSLAPVTQATVKSTVSGQVQRVLVQEGQTVRPGDLLAEMDSTDARSRLEAALADQAERRARLDIAARNRDTNQTLLQQNFISQNAFDQLHGTYQAALAAVQWADAQVKLARQSIADAASWPGGWSTGVSAWHPTPRCFSWWICRVWSSTPRCLRPRWRRSRSGRR